MVCKAKEVLYKLPKLPDKESLTHKMSLGTGALNFVASSLK